MKSFCAIILGLLFQFTYCQSKIKSISPTVDLHNSLNIQIIETLGNFLETKDSKLWLESDFKKFQFPFYEIMDIQNGKMGSDFYQPSLMEIIPTDKDDQKIIKIAFIGYNPKTKSNLIKAIYNMIASKKEGKIFFSKYINYATKDWTEKKEDNITYSISPLKKANNIEIEKQKTDIKQLSEFFETEKFPIYYYSTVSPEEAFKLKGFDYHPMMYTDQSGGFAEPYNIIISGNNSEYYTHEVVHLYTAKLFPKINSYFDEGIATYFGGSGKYDYLWQKEKLKKYLKENPDFDVFKHFNIYEKLYFEKETPIPYVVSAVLCEMILIKFGKEKLFTVFKNGNSVEKVLESFHLNQKNINSELRQFLKN
ncbi:hypothetical protein [Chryseobacterium oryzae]|uniref:Peptidase MA superfamily protein n=1 Tax=Chryseobacterium oryzae TaxID=2929799 RepID=A0ABY4BK49_9FLAO|nr:hypothetical protein [Chryseobacterium oryzae]UOE39547.1 hypothetical protein MTP08_07155 [Chryseobacterium oryzae]